MDSIRIHFLPFLDGSRGACYVERMTFFRMVRFGLSGCLLVGLVLGAGCGGLPGREAREERDPLLRRARALRNAKDIEGAVEYYHKAIDKKPGLARAHLELASIYDQSQGDYVRAIYHYERYLQFEPQAEKKELVQDLIRHARLSFAASLPDRPNEAVREIAMLKQEVKALQGELERLQGGARIAPPRATPVMSAVKPPVAAPAVVTSTADPLVEAPTPVVMEPYVVQSGDTLSRIAAKVYGDSKRSQEIFEANRNVLPNQNSLKVGQTLQIPRKNR